MSELKYKVGDKVTLTNGDIMTVDQINDKFKWYLMREDPLNCYTDEMIEGLVKEETKPIDFTIKATDTKGKVEVVIPDGYSYVIENDKLYFITEKKDVTYPKTYEECCKVLGVSEFEYNHTGTKMWYRHKLMATLDNLMLCRDAYWKIAGEEMGLGKPWKPDWNDTSIKYCLERDFDAIDKNVSNHKGHTFTFPTEEMRDAFKENFDPDIEICKEFL